LSKSNDYIIKLLTHNCRIDCSVWIWDGSAILKVTMIETQKY